MVNIRSVSQTGSTNDDLAALAMAGAPEGLWLRADRQTGGKGRQGRAWQSPPGNLYASTLVRLQPDDPSAATLALVAAVALHEAVRPEAPATLIKWPNDLLVDGAKLAGILLERQDDAVVIGFGVNLAFHPILADRPATSLKALAGRAPSPHFFLARLAPIFQAWLDRWRADIDACYAGTPPAALAALTRHIHTFGLRREDFHAMIDGMAMDAAEDICAPDEATLDLYCDRVASAAGRLSVRIFGMAEEPGRELSHHLGRALQLTNILRDIDEDADINRSYLPRELLAREGISVMDPHQIAAEPSLPRVCETLAERAKHYFAKADAIMDAAPRAQVKAPRIMSGVYRVLLERTLDRGFDLPRTKITKPKARLMWIVARYALF